MIRHGKVMSLDLKSNTGIIRDQRGKDWFFSIEECKDGILPPNYSTVTFIQDEDFRTTMVACLIQIDQLARAI